MDLSTFDESAAVQKLLIETSETRTLGVGAMTAQRWSELSQQLVDLNVIEKALPAQQLFIWK